jgi:Putative beta-barrel porin 2
MLYYHSKINIATARCQVVIRHLVVWMVVLLAPAINAQQTFKIGHFQGNVGAQAGFEYTDNINNSPHKQSDLSLLVGPTFNGGITLPVHFGSNAGDEMTFNTGFSYQEKVSLTTNTATQTFNSPLSVDLMIPGRFFEWKVAVGDTFSYENVNLDSAVLANEPQVSTYNNVASINMDRSFGKSELGLGFERIDKISSAKTMSETDYQFSVTPGWILRENYKLFWANTYGLVFPESDNYTRQDVENYTSEIGVSGQITPYFNGSISAGYGLSHLNEKAEPGTTNVLHSQWTGGPSASMTGSYTHPLKPNTTYSIGAYYSPGVTALLSSSSAQSVLGVTVSVAHRLTPNLTLAPTVQWTSTSSIGGSNSGEKVDMISLGIGLNRQFTRHLSASIDYKYIDKASNLPLNTYDVSRITAQATYTF